MFFKFSFVMELIVGEGILSWGYVIISAEPYKYSQQA